MYRNVGVRSGWCVRDQRAVDVVRSAHETVGVQSKVERRCVCRDGAVKFS